jgi:hypothetical protein
MWALIEQSKNWRTGDTKRSGSCESGPLGDAYHDKEPTVATPSTIPPQPVRARTDSSPSELGHAAGTRSTVEPEVRVPFVRPLHHSSVRTVGFVAALALGWAGVVLLAAHVQAPTTVRHIALFVHLVSVVAGFGAVLAVDLLGVLWLTGRRDLRDVASLAMTLELLIWSGLVGLTISGIFLEPEMAPRTWVKMTLVFVVIVNGCHARRLIRFAAHAPAALRPAGAPPCYFRQVVVTSAVSQIGWWGALVIGFWTTLGRHGG